MTGGPAAATRVLVVDDAASTRHFLRSALENSRLFVVVGEAADVAGAVEAAAALDPEIILLDDSLPGGSPDAVVAGPLHEVAPHAAVVILSSRPPRVTADPAEAGAHAILPKGLPEWDLVERLCEVVGRPFLMTAPPPPPLPPEPTDAGGRAHRAVVCDVDAMTRRLVGRVLAGVGVEVVAETDVVANLLAAVASARPDVVVLDLWLEGTTGLSALPELLDISPATAMVVYSGRTEWRERAIAAGAAVFIEKPDFAELETWVGRLVGTPAADPS